MFAQMDVTRTRDETIVVSLVMDGDVFESALEVAQVVERNARVVRALDHEARFFSSFWWIGAPEHERGTHSGDALWDEVRQWDLEHIVEPLLACLDVAPYVLLFPGRCPLTHFSIRAALRHGARRGACPVETLLRVPSVALWAGQGCQRLEALARERRLPLVREERVRLLLAPMPGQVAATIEALMERERRGIPVDWKEMLVPHYVPDLRIAAWAAQLLTTLADQAERAGVSVVRDARRAEFLETLTSGSEEESLILFAHQDSRGIHLADGVLSMDLIRAHLARRMRTGAHAYGSVDLAVCGSEEPGNLAECLQAFGCPVVMARGQYAYFGSAAAGWLGRLRCLGERGAMPLPHLVDLAWVMRHSSAY